MKDVKSLLHLSSVAKQTSVARRVGRITSLRSTCVDVEGLSDIAKLGDVVYLDADIQGEVVGVSASDLQVMVDGATSRLKLGQSVFLVGRPRLLPNQTWLGRVVDGNGSPLDNQPILRGTDSVPIDAKPPPATSRRAFGSRLSTGYALFNTVLPIVRGQRLGLFSGSGVGKSSLMAAFARELEADVVVIGLIGERGREVNHFVNRVLGKEGLKRSVVIAATSDKSALARRRAAFSAMAIAEYFRDQGKHVLLMLDSITRVAEAHREIAISSGEPCSMRGYPPSLTNLLAGFAERAGPGADEQGDITAIFTVLVPGSNMEEPVADILRGLLDGHVVLSRDIAERGRYPAVDILQSVSRSLPEAASEEENRLIQLIRQTLSLFEESEIMVRSGLYQSGTNAELDLAIELNPKLDKFASERSISIETSFSLLSEKLNSV